MSFSLVDGARGIVRVVATMAAAVAFSACASSSMVALNDGSTAYDVSCMNGRWACSSEAERVCGGGKYVVLDEDDVTTVLSGGKNGSLRIQCVDEYVAAHAPAAPAPAAP